LNNPVNHHKEIQIYFASDFHLGVPGYNDSLVREKLFIKWLDEIKTDASEIYLMGDIFDFWFEYRTVVPKGFVRLLGKLAEITDSGIPVHVFRGNHDVWAFDYLNTEVNLQLHRKPEIKLFGDKKFFIAHGDGLGPGDTGYKILKKIMESRLNHTGYKILKKIMESRLNQWLFKWLHPDIGTRMGLYFSRRSRYANIAKEGKKENINHVEEEPLYKFSLAYLKNNPDVDYFIFGHRHLPVKLQISKSTEFVLLGDWVTNFSYAVFDGNSVSLRFYK
jgi:UDP-2,3-diacylglucosamine hydrolase